MSPRAKTLIRTPHGSEGRFVVSPVGQLPRRAGILAATSGANFALKGRALTAQGETLGIPNHAKSKRLKKSARMRRSGDPTPQMPFPHLLTCSPIHCSTALAAPAAPCSPAHLSRRQERRGSSLPDFSPPQDPRPQNARPMLKRASALSPSAQSPNGARYDSPGQRPGSEAKPDDSALKGRATVPLKSAVQQCRRHCAQINRLAPFPAQSKRLPLLRTRFLRRTDRRDSYVASACVRTHQHNMTLPGP